MLKKLFSAPIFFLLCSVSVLADVPEYAVSRSDFDLGTVTVEALPWNHPESITGRPDGETYFEILPATGHSTLSESLDGQMGISLRSSGGAGTVCSISSGGLSGNKILVVKDGLPVNDPFTGTPDIGDYPTLQFEQAEFWAGNRATMWGSSSIGGVLRLTSRFPDDGRLRLWTDGHGGRGHAVETRIYPGKTKLGVRVSQFTTPGFS
ncbi:MAG: TonB-dependent receptor plug domain-containing protein, partial [Candidatus Riflebacteria bacterium]|nr:TonB-dependent receptor plug domain-containing protein [Candidatus Riflebacteria bacterium]